MNKISKQIITILNNEFSSKKMSLHEPKFEKNDVDLVTKCIKSSYVSSVGDYVCEFEELIKKETGSPYVVAVNSGTSALHSALYVLNISHNDEVLIPTLNFVAAANAICYLSAIPHFIDSRAEDLSIDSNKLDQYLKANTKLNSSGECINKNTGNKIKAIIVFHPYGFSADIKNLIKITKKYHLKMIEDSAECLGSKYDGTHLGTFGDIGILSFNGNKIVTTGGGGALMTNNKKLANKLLHITKTSKKPHPFNFNHDNIGFNYRLPNLNAALGCSQIKKLKSFIEKKENIHMRYKSMFENFQFGEILEKKKLDEPNYWINNLILKKEFSNQLDEILHDLNNSGIFARPIWNLLHNLPYLKSFPKMNLSNAMSWRKKTINLPSSHFLLG